MNKLDQDYLALGQDILDNGYIKGDRTGAGSKCLFKKQIRHKMSHGFPLLTTKKLHFRSISAELIWFLSGSTNIRPLIDNHVNIWNSDAYKKYQKTHNNHPAIHSNRFDILSEEEFVKRIQNDNMFAAMNGDLGPIYGKQWRAWNRYEIQSYSANQTDLNVYRVKEIDQIADAIQQLRTTPDSRRIIVKAWNPAEIQEMTLPPCHMGFQLDCRELEQKERMEWAQQHGIQLERFYSGILKLDEDLDNNKVPKYEMSLGWEQRSVDVPLGLPYNIASYGLLLLLLCKEVNMIPGEIIGDLGNTHIYLNQVEGIKEQLKRKPYKLPTITILNPSGALTAGKVLSNYTTADFILADYQSHPHIKMPLNT